MDEVKRAYAVLGLEQGSPMTRVKTRYRALVRTWHPDRYAADAKSQAEAAIRMRAINTAYGTLVRHLRPGRRPAGPTVPPKSGPEPGRRLSQEEIDRMVRAIGSEGPIDALLGAVGWIGNSFEGFFFVLFLFSLVAQAVATVSTDGVLALFSDFEFMAIVALFAIVWLRESWERRHLHDAVGPETASGSGAESATQGPR